jgi:hypothetical protein
MFHKASKQTLDTEESEVHRRYNKRSTRMRSSLARNSSLASAFLAVVFVSIISVLCRCEAYATIHRLSNGSSHREYAAPQLSAAARRDVLVATSHIAAATVAALVMATVVAQPALATDNDSNIISAQLAGGAALRTMKLCLKKLQSDGTVFSVTNNEYGAVKELLRVAPLSDIRKSASTLVIRTAGSAGTDGSSTEAFETMTSQYKALIGAIEIMDGKASVAMRGRKLIESEFYGSYATVVERLQDFVATAEKTLVLVPVVAN